MTNLNIIFITLLVSSSLAIKLNQETAHLKNIDYLLSGYNVFYGNPFPTSGSVDPGFRKKIFLASYVKKLRTGDKRFIIPDGLEMQKNDACDMSMTNTEITGETSFKNTLSVEASIEGTIKGIEFSASNEFKNIYEDTEKKKIVYINSSADCKVYKGLLSNYNPPAFSDDFMSGLNSVSTLPFENNKEAFYKFINNFGTHFVEEVTMGARFGARTKVTTSNLSKLRQNTLTIKRALGIEKLAKLSTGITNDNVQNNKTDELFEETKIYTIGSKIPEDLKAQSWAQKAIDEPMPINYKLLPISDLFLTNNIEIKNNKDNIITFNTITFGENLKKALNNYCKDVLLSQGKVRSCDTLRPDVAIETFKFDVIVPHSQEYLIKNMETGKCIHGTYNGRPLAVSTCNSKEVYMFWHFQTGNNKYGGWGIVQGPWGSRTYDVALDHDWKGGPIYQIHHKNYQSQSFDVISNKDGSYTFKGSSGRCVEPKDGNSNEETMLVENLCNGFETQKWIVIKK